jgi:starch synthase (maltosyl-transferring)
LIGRVAITDLSPTIYFGGEFIPVKAIVAEEILVSATVAGEGHDYPQVQVVTRDSKGKELSRTAAVERNPGTDRYEALIALPQLGHFTFEIEAAIVTQYRTVTTNSPQFPVYVERERALVGAWYEFFPRSEGASINKDGTYASGNFGTAAKRLKAVKDMGFDVLYIPPIHPIGISHRKGPNNTLTAGPNDPGVPWGIGNSDGGHDAINPVLGSMKDFESFVKEANKLGLEIALDLALQTSPDHPWVKEHPKWFNYRADGTIAYAENPPKKYQDIYPINFDDDFDGLVAEVYRICELWISKGVTIFRVDNPHTKPVLFWQTLISKVNAKHPEIVFLAEAFTKPAMMHALGKAGFQQSYTYFTWRTTKHELTEYGNEVSHQTSAFFRPNFWVNTPDILPFHLQSGNPAMFALRAVLASTLTPSWGMYAGYELFEHRVLSEGREEYLDSEKYQIKVRDWDGAKQTLVPLVTKLNKIRNANRALQRLRNLHFHQTDNEAIIAYSKRDGDNLVLVIVNLDPSNAQATVVHWNMDLLGLAGDSFVVDDQITGNSFSWNRDSFVSLDPRADFNNVAHIAVVRVP